MKYLKIIGLAAVAAMALMASAGAGTASAKAVLCESGTTAPCATKWSTPKELDFSLKSGTSALLQTTEKLTLNTCTESTVKGTLTANPNASGNAEGTISAANLTFGKCTTEGVKTLKGGKLTVTKALGSGNGEVVADEVEVTVPGPFGSCVFGAGNGTVLGTLTEGKASPATPTATLDITNAVVTRISGLCPASALWTGEYVLTSPTETTLAVTES
jgi:hypothetical protein